MYLQLMYLQLTYLQLMYLQSHIYKKYSSKFWFYNYLKSRSIFVFTLYFYLTLFLPLTFMACYGLSFTLPLYC